MLRVFLALTSLILSAGWAQAQWNGPWSESIYQQRPGYFEHRRSRDAYRPQRARPSQQGVFYIGPTYNSSSNDDDDDDKPLSQAPAVMDGGPKVAVSPMSPQTVPFRSQYGAGTIVIDTKGRKLYLVTSTNSALRYPISVGREGFSWTGTEKISRMADWPDWHPPEEMRERDPRLPIKMTGGLRNPLGAKALYLGNSLYRIHGTSDAKSIGRASSSGCFRMLNGHVVDLSKRVGVGTRVVVLNKLPPGTTRLASND